MRLQPITNADEFRAVLNIVVRAEAEGYTLLARPLRALIDASPFDACQCNGHSRPDNEPPCTICGGDGFVPGSFCEGEALSSPFRTKVRPLDKHQFCFAVGKFPKPKEGDVGHRSLDFLKLALPKSEALALVHLINRKHQSEGGNSNQADVIWEFPLVGLLDKLGEQ